MVSKQKRAEYQRTYRQRHLEEVRAADRARHARRWAEDESYRSRMNESQLKTQARRAERFAQYKESLQCERCGFADGRALQFHHRDPATKRFNVASKARHLSWARLMEEIEKCEVLCANCHAIETTDGRYIK